MEKTETPHHVGLILDGNRRWARSKGLSIAEGHRRGLENFTEIAETAFKSGVKYVSAYIFSTENWSRSEKEVNYLMRLINKHIMSYAKSLNEEGIKVIVLGRRNGIRKKLLNTINKTEESTKNNSKGTLALCFNYGGADEMVDAARSLIASGVPPEEITKEKFETHLYGGNEVPPLDFVIRTSGEERLSGFMLYRSAYAELYFTEKNWPDFTPEDFKTAISEYSSRKRRFGK